MPADAGRALVPPAHRVAVIVALGVERRCFRGLIRSSGPEVIQSGPGAARARAAAEAALSHGAGALVSWGLAGGLDAAAVPGALALPHRVVTSEGRSFETDDAWRARIAQAVAGVGALVHGPLLAADAVLGTPADKARAATATGAAAVDTESGAIAACAERAGVPFVALRAIADGARDALPPGVDRWVDDQGNPLLRPVLAAAFSPRAWPGLLTLMRRYRAARRTLDDAARILSQSAFLAPSPPL